MDDITPIAKAILLSIFLYSFHCDAFAQTFSVKGQFEFGSLTSNDIPDSWRSYESFIGYIPTLSLGTEISSNKLLHVSACYSLVLVQDVHVYVYVYVHVHVHVCS